MGPHDQNRAGPVFYPEHLFWVRSAETYKYTPTQIHPKAAQRRFTSSMVRVSESTSDSAAGRFLVLYRENIAGYRV